mgnify:CR=1 FL=1
MMTDNEKNIRTLVVCFVLAVMVLIPLRIVEAGRLIGETKVLGEMEEVDDNSVIEEVIDEGDVEDYGVLGEMDEVGVDEDGQVVEEEVPVEEMESVLPDAGEME